MGRLVQRELRNGLVGLLLTGLTHEHSAALAGPSSAPAPAHVKRVEEFLRAHPDRETSVTELADIAGVSLRALQDGFRRFRNTTLTEAIRDARLAQWRKLLELPPHGAGVGTLALAAGLTRFSAAPPRSITSDMARPRRRRCAVTGARIETWQRSRRSCSRPPVWESDDKRSGAVHLASAALVSVNKGSP